MIRYFLTALILFTGSVSAEQTLSIIKPDAVKGNNIGDILAHYEDGGLKIVALKMVQLTPEQAGQFYEVHKERPFFEELTTFMSSSPVVVVVLDGDKAISKNRELMGATDPKKATEGTIRWKYGNSIGENAVHGSDSEATAKEEIQFFFGPHEIH
ncbi:MAG: Nucleoside diphosphate kinase [Chlamydiae bacterium]|nr:Nucleoside diphosphate kinase [Chlamydiota bacterium]